MPEVRTIDCDVLVAGSGAGGMAAAVTARKHGLDVVVAEKEPWFGGTTASSRPWKKMIGQDRRSTWWIGERAR